MTQNNYKMEIQLVLIYIFSLLIIKKLKTALTNDNVTISMKI